MKQAIKEGEYVKVGIVEDGGVEKLWFEVMFIDNDNTFIGRCDNMPIAITKVDYNGQLKLSITDIIEIHNETGNNIR